MKLIELFNITGRGPVISADLSDDLGGSHVDSMRAFDHLIGKEIVFEDKLYQIMSIEMFRDSAGFGTHGGLAVRPIRTAQFGKNYYNLERVAEALKC